MSNLTCEVTFEGPLHEIIAGYQALVAAARELTPSVNATFHLTGSVNVDEVEQLGSAIGMNTPIEQLFSNSKVEYRIKACLRRAGVYTIGDLVTKDVNDLLALTNFGPKSLDVVTNMLAEHGYALTPSHY